VRLIQRIFGLLIPMALACGQHSATRPAFEVATIKPAPPYNGGPMRVGFDGGPGSKDPGRWSTQNMSLKNLITFAYNLKQYEIVIPEWTSTERFDVHAKVPEGATKDDLKLMVQSLLEERFKLTFHREQKEMAGYELAVAKNGPKLKEAASQAPSDADATPKPPGPLKMGADGYPILPAGRGSSMAIMNGRARMVDREMTIEALASQISTQIGKPVADATGLKGKYDVVLSWVTESARTRPIGAGGADGAVGIAQDESGPTIFAALQEQLGLKLEQKKTTISIMVVDKIEKTPTEN
jgi:uncharacterized protein (TIGR03435 family)